MPGFNHSAYLDRLTEGWNRTTVEALRTIASMPVSVGIRVAHWPHYEADKFDQVARMFMQWYQIILVPPHCRISRGTINAWQASEMTTAAGAVAIRPAILESDNRTLWDLLALIPIILLLIVSSRH